MKLLKIYTGNHQGFTLIEILIVVALFALILVAGGGVDFSILRSSSLLEEENRLVNILERARELALDNIGGMSHGVQITESDYVLFEGETFDGEAETNDPISRNQSIALSGDSTVVFESVSANITTPVSFVLSNEVSSKEITVDYEGRINWQ